MRLYTPPLYYVISVGKLLQFVPAVCTVNDVCITRIQIGARARARASAVGTGREGVGGRALYAREREGQIVESIEDGRLWYSNQTLCAYLHL